MAVSNEATVNRASRFTSATGTLVAQVSLPLTLLIERGANAQALLPQRALTVALLVDGENCSPDLVAAALAEADKYGVVHVRRVYANWAVMSQRSWKEALSRHHLEAIHHERTAIGKNATDIALVVDAMDLLHSGVITCFCLLASDSDYTPLVERLRAADRVVVGLGRAQTPSSLTQACSVFVHLEPSGSPAASLVGQPASPALRLVTAGAPILQPAKETGAPPLPDSAAPAILQRSAAVQEGQRPRSDAPPQAAALSDAGSDPGALLLKAWGAVLQTRGEVSLSNLVTEIQQRYPELRPETYGHVRLAPLIKQRTDLFTIRQGTKDPSHLIVERVARPTTQAGKAVVKLDGPGACLPHEPLASPGHAAVRALLVTAWQRAVKQDGWLCLSAFGMQIRRIDPTFVSSTYGHGKLKTLIKANGDLFELRQRSDSQCDVRLLSASRA